MGNTVNNQQNTRHKQESIIHSKYEIYFKNKTKIM